MSIRHILSPIALALGMAVASTASADRSLGVFRDWSAMSFGSGKDMTCMAFSQPTKSEGQSTGRGDAFVFVTHRPGDDQRDRVSLETGYRYGDGTPAKITVDSSEFPLRTDGSTAWLLDPARDAELVAAMKAGRVMVVEGTSARGTRTRDEYSLLGFTAAASAIDGACK